MWDERCAVVVVGSGAAGCAAALGALRNAPGEKVLVLEKGKFFGGTTKLSGGGWCWFPRNPYLRALGVDQPEDSVVELLAALSQENDPDRAPPTEHSLALMRAFARESPAILEELKEHQLFELHPAQVFAARSKGGCAEEQARTKALLHDRAAEAARRKVETGLSGVLKDGAKTDALTKCMPDYCADHALDLVPAGRVLEASGSTSGSLLKSLKKFPNCECRKLCCVTDVVFENGRAVGVVCEQDGKETRILASRGVVFGSGGYSHDQKLLTEQFHGAVAGTCSARSNTGDLLAIAAKHGIPLKKLHLAWWKQVVMPFDPQRTGVFFLNADSFIVCDRTGRRFQDEKSFYQERGLKMLDSTKPGADVDRRLVFFVFDARARDRFAGPLKGMGGPIPWAVDDDERKEQSVNALQEAACLVTAEGATGAAVCADLAQKVQAKLKAWGAPLDLAPDFASCLDQTLQTFNAGAEKGEDELGRGSRVSSYGWSVARQPDNTHPNKCLMPLAYARSLHCVVLGLSTLDTKGGPEIDTSARVLGANGPVPGLFGAGNCVCSYSERSYPSAGATISNAITFGFIAGREAAKMPELTARL